MTPTDQDIIRRIIREELRLILYGSAPVEFAPGHEAEKARCIAEVKAKLEQEAKCNVFRF